MATLDKNAPQAATIHTLLDSVTAQLREVIARHGGSLMKIADAVRRKYGVKLDGSYLSRMLRGKVEIPLRTLLALCDYLGVNPGMMLDAAGGDDADPETLVALIAADQQTGGFFRECIERHGAMATSHKLSRLVFTINEFTGELTTEKSDG